MLFGSGRLGRHNHRPAFHVVHGVLQFIAAPHAGTQVDLEPLLILHGSFGPVFLDEGELLFGFLQLSLTIEELAEQVVRLGDLILIPARVFG